MRILVATATRHGATREIGDRLAAAVRQGMGQRHADAEIVALDVAEVDAVADYDAIVLGSAVYMGRWLKSARQFADREFSELETRPVWLFSSGPVGDDQKIPNTMWDKAPWAIEHKTFGGKLDRSLLSRRERAVVTLIKAPDGDYRSWPGVEKWAESICSRLAIDSGRVAVT